MAAITLEQLKDVVVHLSDKEFEELVEQDHRAIKRRVNASQCFRSFWAAWRTLAGYEVIHMIRKGQACGSAPTRVGLLHRFIVGMFGIEV
jgi:IS6 family transposase